MSNSAAFNFNHDLELSRVLRPSVNIDGSNTHETSSSEDFSARFQFHVKSTFYIDIVLVLQNDKTVSSSIEYVYYYQLGMRVCVILVQCWF